MNLDIRDAKGNSASYWASEKEHKECMALLGPPLKLSADDIYKHIKNIWAVTGYEPKKKGKKGKKGGKKKKK